MSIKVPLRQFPSRALVGETNAELGCSVLENQNPLLTTQFLHKRQPGGQAVAGS